MFKYFNKKNLLCFESFTDQIEPIKIIINTKQSIFETFKQVFQQYF